MLTLYSCIAGTGERTAGSIGPIFFFQASTGSDSVFVRIDEVFTVAAFFGLSEAGTSLTAFTVNRYQTLA